jgi:serine/threonine protein kinase
MTTIADGLEKLKQLLDAGALTPEEYATAKAGLLSKISGTGEPVSGSQVGNYRILSRVGEGGMGVVYRARHQDERFASQQGGDVAIKLIHAQYANNAGHVERFFREARLGMELSHPNLLPVYETVNESGRVGMVMAWAEGRPLSTMIGTETGPIPWDRAKSLVWQMLDAVAYAHGHGVIHRDLKPENVMVDISGGVKVLDFGIAKTSQDQRTKTGTGMGTVDYMAPEQYTDAGQVDARADIYALGMTIYEMVAGRLPWASGLSEFEVLRRKSTGDVPLPTTHYPDIPAHVVSAVMACLSVSPAKRPSDVAALRWRLSTPVVAHSPVSARASVAPPSMVVAPSPVVAAREPSAMPTVREAAVGTSSAPVPPIAPAASPWPRRLAEGGLVLLAASVGWMALRSNPFETSMQAAGPQLAPWESPSLGTMVHIPLGTFTMGCKPGRDDVAGGCDSDATPHSVTLTKAYYLMEHEVTQGEWQAVMGGNPSWFTTCGSRCPVEQVSWDDVQAFVAKVSARDGVTYRLPTEAEWEWAARGGQEFAYAGSNEVGAVGWYRDNSAKTTHPVCGKARNGYGLCDMTGNVEEWVGDWRADYGSASATDPRGPSAGSLRVSRGGGWSSFARVARVARRDGGDPANRDDGLGFRLLRPVP